MSAAAVTATRVSTVIATAAVSASICVSVRGWVSVVVSPTVVPVRVGMIVPAAIITAVVSAVHANVRVVRVSRGDVRIGVGRGITVSVAICRNRWRNSSAYSEPANSDAHHHVLGEETTAGQ